MENKKVLQQYEEKIIGKSFEEDTDLQAALHSIRGIQIILPEKQQQILDDIGALKEALFHKLYMALDEFKGCYDFEREICDDLTDDAYARVDEALEELYMGMLALQAMKDGAVVMNSEECGIDLDAIPEES